MWYWLIFSLSPPPHLAFPSTWRKRKSSDIAWEVHSLSLSIYDGFTHTLVPWVYIFINIFLLSRDASSKVHPSKAEQRGWRKRREISAFVYECYITYPFLFLVAYVFHNKWSKNNGGVLRDSVQCFWMTEERRKVSQGWNERLMIWT